MGSREQASVEWFVHGSWCGVAKYFSRLSLSRVNLCY